MPDFAATLLNTSASSDRQYQAGIDGDVDIDVNMDMDTTSTSPSTRMRVPDSSLSPNRSRQPYLSENEFRSDYSTATSESRRRMLRDMEATLEEGRRVRVDARETLAGSRRAAIEADVYRRRLYEWAAEGGSDEDEDGREEEMDDDDDEDDEDDAVEERDGWRDLEEALSSHRRRRNAGRTGTEGGTDPEGRQWTVWPGEQGRGQAREARGDSAVEAGSSSSVRERAARRREERIVSLIEGSQSQRLRYRASRERVLRAMEGFMAERERRGGGGLSREELRDVEVEATRREIERRPGVQLHRSERVAAMMKERQRNGHTLFRNMVEYLSRLRKCDLSNEDETIDLAIDLGIARKFIGEDFMLETRSIQPPPWTSLLTAGSTFTGSQHAPHDASGAHLLNRDRDYLRRMVANRNLSSAHLPRSIAALADVERYLLDHPSIPHQTSTITMRAQNRAPDHWPVSVTLHSVDMENLIITGTMSANHIPDKFSPTSPDHKPDGSSMKSYFEGEIIDMNKFTLETETYKNEGVAVDIETDVEYWKQLGPFREEVEKATQDITKPSDAHFKADVQLAACLGSSDWINRALGREWILMRYVEHSYSGPDFADMTQMERTLLSSTVGQ